MVPVALTIAGSDSSGGAGIQADLKAFAAAGCFGTSAIVALTAQNTVGVTAIHELPPELVLEQLDAVFDDIGVDAAKTGMLFSRGIIEAVAGYGGAWLYWVGTDAAPVKLSTPVDSIARSVAGSMIATLGGAPGEAPSGASGGAAADPDHRAGPP